MKQREYSLKCECPRFYSEYDESVFFRWLKQSLRHARVQGSGRIIELTFSESDISSENIRELTAVCARYNIKMSGMDKLADGERFGWLRDPSKFWYNLFFT